MHIENIHINLGERESTMASAFIQSLFAKVELSPNAPADTPTAGTPLLIPKIGAPWPGIGGKYAGISLGEDGAPDGHLILLDDMPDKELTWDDAVKWADSLGSGARLLTRFESALIYANLRGHVATEQWHWTGMQSSSRSAWFQNFDSGDQSTFSKGGKARARAVRRLVLS
jgi:hypothetical protein